jgi:hypothetical protein
VKSPHIIAFSEYKDRARSILDIVVEDKRDLLYYRRDLLYKKVLPSEVNHFFELVVEDF